MHNRLPALPRSSDRGYVYVVELGGIYKIGFSRTGDIGGRLVLAIPTGQRPSCLERTIHKRFADKLTNGPGFKREWFALDAEDLRWLHGFAAFHAWYSSTHRV